MDSELSEALNLIPVVNSERKYWFIRTEGGRLFDLFHSHNLVAVGYERIKGDALRQLAGEKEVREELKKLVKRNYPQHLRPGLIVTQIYRFFYEVQKGDVVIIPSYSSDKLLFGEIQGDEIFPVELYDKENEEKRPFELSRKVKWDKAVNRDALNPKLYSLFFSHHAISSGDAYASFIDNELHDFYMKGSFTHLIIPIKKDKDIKARILSKFSLDLLDLTDTFLEENSIAKETDDIQIKSNVNSPGTLELIGQSAVDLFVLGVIIVGLAGGSFQFKFKELEGKMHTPGILKRFQEFFKQQQQFKLLETIVKDLKIRGAEDLRAVLRKLIPKQ